MSAQFDELLAFRCAPEERRLVEFVAASEGKTLSDVLRGIVLPEARRVVARVLVPEPGFEELRSGGGVDPQPERQTELDAMREDLAGGGGP